MNRGNCILSTFVESKQGEPMNRFIFRKHYRGREAVAVFSADLGQLLRLIEQAHVDMDLGYFSGYKVEVMS